MADSLTLKGTALDDLTATRRCAEAIGGRYDTHPDGVGRFIPSTAHPAQNIFSFDRYDPLHDDAQAMALVKRFGLGFDRNIILGEWHVIMVDERSVVKNQGADADLNRAIVYCVAKMKAAIREGSD